MVHYILLFLTARLCSRCPKNSCFFISSTTRARAVLMTHFHENYRYTQYGNEVYILSGPSMKHGRLEAYPSLSHSGLYWSSIYFSGKNVVICYVIERQVMAFFVQKNDQKNLWSQIDFLIICNLFWSNNFLIRCQTKVLLYWNLSTRVGNHTSVVHIMASRNFITIWPYKEWSLHQFFGTKTTEANKSLKTDAKTVLYGTIT
jgi:hypothetical protein